MFTLLGCRCFRCAADKVAVRNGDSICGLLQEEEEEAAAEDALTPLFSLLFVKEGKFMLSTPFDLAPLL